MKRRVKTGIVVLLLAMLIPVALSVAQNSENNPQSSAAAVQTAPPSNPPAPTLTPSAVSASATSYGYSNGNYLWVCCLNDQYSWGSTTYIPIKVELWDNKGAAVNRATIYSYLSMYYNGTWSTYYPYSTQSTGDNGLDAKLLYSLTPGRYWYSFIEGYYYDPNGNFHYAYQTKYFYT